MSVISVKLKAKATFILDQILKSFFFFFLTVLFWKKLLLNFSERELCFLVRMEGKLKEVLELGPHGVKVTQALLKRGWKHSHHRAGADRGGWHFWLLGCKSSCPHPHSAPRHKGHANPFSNHVLHPKTKSSHFRL